MSNRALLKLYDENFLNFLKNVNIFLIGVGGIGCEVLK